MAKALLISPTAENAGLTSICLGLVRALDSIGVRVAFLKPITQSIYKGQGVDLAMHFVRAKTQLLPPSPLEYHYAQSLMSQKKSGELQERIVGLYNECTKTADLVVVEGLMPEKNSPYATAINVQIARNLDANVILVATPKNMPAEELDSHLDLAARHYASPDEPEVIGCILNKVNEPEEANQNLYTPEVRSYKKTRSLDYAKQCKIFNDDSFRLIGAIPWRTDLIAPRTSDVANQLETIPINLGDQLRRRVTNITICARTVTNMVDAFLPGTLVVTPGDREDVLIATCMAALSGIPLAGIILTGNLNPDPRTLKLCGKAFDTGLPVFSTHTDTFITAKKLSDLNTEVPVDDLERIETAMDVISDAIDAEWIKEKCSISREPRLSPPAFRYLLASRAAQAKKTIVLPEGNEPRTIEAAAICSQRKVARCLLLGNSTEINRIAVNQGFDLPDDVTIIDPDTVRNQYIEKMVELRKHKGLTHQMAEAQLEDNVVLGTMMVATGEVDGLVSGAIHTTANTIRPALQLIKTRPGAKVVSSVFFMCLPEQVLVYGDCAVNPNPNTEELADIAIQSAESAETFGITPKVAMISYSTGDSGSGEEVNKVKTAVAIAQSKRPDLMIDGPLQYDAAAIASVASTKAPNSKVAGKATVFIFPDLNTGNTTYKAVQRSANVISIGPMLQGLRKPVNDLSRGALVEDIVFTIALTAVQAAQPTESPQETEIESTREST
ncbi:MAG: phosphate acetyltransferase [Gammaproteobacteria bacterium]|nr:MAG: phosphate acetyltransferase [Gammaproteobacteria bacterium]